MKHFISLIAVLFLCTTAFAQSTTKRVATLSHEGTITTFSGVNALINAVGAAVDGDVITLSSGHFNGNMTIDKNLTIRGAGMELNPQDGTQTTYISGTCYLGSNDNNNPLNGLRIEGAYFDSNTYLNSLMNAQFSKCFFVSLAPNLTTNTVAFTHCRIIVTGQFRSSKEFSLVNCDIVFNDYAWFGSIAFLTDEFNFQNCHVWFNSQTSEFRCCNFTNCILRGHANDAQGLNGNNAVDHSLVINAAGRNLLANLGSKVGCYELSSSDGVFESQGYWVLTDEAKAQYKGSDGTEVGFYGGPLPYDPFMKNPRITKFNVAPKTTADGKLSVDIEVEGANN